MADKTVLKSISSDWDETGRNTFTMTYFSSDLDETNASTHNGDEPALPEYLHSRHFLY